MRTNLDRGIFSSGNNIDVKHNISRLGRRVLALFLLSLPSLISLPKSAEAKASFGAFVSVDATENGCEVIYAETGKGGKTTFAQRAVVGDENYGSKVQIVNPNDVLRDTANDEWWTNVQPGRTVGITAVGDSCVVSVSADNNEPDVAVRFADGGPVQQLPNGTVDTDSGVDKLTVIVNMGVGIQGLGEER